MNIEILHMFEGAKAAKGVAVIIDVFRAFTVEAYIMKNGAKKLIPVGDMQIAYDYKEKHPDAILVGERHGVTLPGFDFGNSPSQLENVDLSGKTVVHTTSAGTQGIANAKNADVVLTGSLVNARAIAEYIKKNDFDTVSLVCMGNEGIEQVEEDNMCAYYIRDLLLGKNDPDIRKKADNMRYTAGAKFFDPARQSVFPQPDFPLCVDVDRFNFVLRVEKSDDGLDYIVREDV